MLVKKFILRNVLLSISCLAQGAIAEESTHAGVYSPLQRAHEEATANNVFLGASLAVYDPINETVDIKVSPEFNLTENSATLPRSIATRGVISVAPPKPITENLLTNLGWSLGAIALSTTLDRDGDSFARQHGQNTSTKRMTRVGNALPFIAFGLAGLAFLDEDPRLSRTGLAALQASGVGAASGLGLKFIFGRSRPELNQGPTQFHATDTKRSDSSTPSIHTAMAWGVITPFAKEYEMPWLYGVAAMTNLARVTDRKHWVSDTVAGSLLGYWLGDIAWHYNRHDDRSIPHVSLGNRSLAFGWIFN